ncbi:hypothetical protein BDR07DRAFT_1491982 [Suillus spraguei]|nr:hypothetical protein BDR07DRAFT_1491982 [Suillus spraguei]
MQINLHLKGKTWRVTKLELSAATQQLLAEAAIYTNNYSNDVSDFADFGDVIGAAVTTDGNAVDSEDSTEEDEGSEMHPPLTGHDRHAVSAA